MCLGSAVKRSRTPSLQYHAIAAGRLATQSFWDRTAGLAQRSRQHSQTQTVEWYQHTRPVQYRWGLRPSRVTWAYPRSGRRFPAWRPMTCPTRCALAPDPTNEAHVGHDVVQGAKQAGRDEGGAVAGEARDAVDAGRLKGFGEGHRRPDSGEPPGQPRRAHPRGPSRRR
jgi:hypothetical protein